MRLRRQPLDPTLAPAATGGFERADVAPAPASLEALLGVPRSALLRRLDEPHTAGQIAHALHYTPSGISFHLGGLEAAGLISRHRRGRHVIVCRTSRGAQLLALYALGEPPAR